MVSKMTFKEFGEFSHNQLKVMLDKSLVYYFLAEGMYFFGQMLPIKFQLFGHSPTYLKFSQFPM